MEEGNALLVTLQVPLNAISIGSSVVRILRTIGIDSMPSFACEFPRNLFMHLSVVTPIGFGNLVDFGVCPAQRFLRKSASGLTRPPDFDSSLARRVSGTAGARQPFLMQLTNDWLKSTLHSVIQHGQEDGISMSFCFGALTRYKLSMGN